MWRAEEVVTKVGGNGKFLFHPRFPATSTASAAAAAGGGGDGDLRRELNLNQFKSLLVEDIRGGPAPLKVSQVAAINT